MNTPILLVCFKLEYHCWALRVFGVNACLYAILYTCVCLTSQEVAVNADSSVSSSRVRLEEFKTRAKRSLTESLEGIWKVRKHFTVFECFGPLLQFLHYVHLTFKECSPCMGSKICAVALVNVHN